MACRGRLQPSQLAGGLMRQLPARMVPPRHRGGCERPIGGELLPVEGSGGGAWLALVLLAGFAGSACSRPSFLILSGTYLQLHDGKTEHKYERRPERPLSVGALGSWSLSPRCLCRPRGSAKFGGKIWQLVVWCNWNRLGADCDNSGSGSGSGSRFWQLRAHTGGSHSGCRRELSPVSSPSWSRPLVRSGGRVRLGSILAAGGCLACAGSWRL